MPWSAKDKLAGRPKQTAQKLKAEVLQAYGGACACCGLKELVFLVIDHIHGGGHQEHQRVGHGSRFYYWLKKQGFPQGNYQVLCHNCNFAKRLGPCPHRGEG